MRALKSILAFFKSRKVDSDLNDELRFHLDKEVELNVARGLSPEEARRRALIAFGGVQQAREAVQQTRWVHSIETLFQDLRYALRLLRKSPAFTTVAVLTLALGIGANTAIFTVVNSVLLQPLRYPQADRILYLGEWHKANPQLSISYLNFKDWQSQNHVFDRMGAVQPQSFVLAGEQPELLSGRLVSEGFFPTLGVQPMLGRGFVPVDDRPSATPVALISYGLWQRRFSGNQGIVGSQIGLDQKSFTVIGVLPRDFEYRGMVNDVFVPLGLRGAEEWATHRGDHPGIYAVARLRPGVSLGQARSEMSAIAGQLAQQYPQTNAGCSVSMVLLQDFIVGDTRPWLLLLLGAVGLVLLIACANIANLLLGRASARAREIAIRAALGASRGRLVRQVLAESVLLALLGGMLGAAAASAGIDLLVKAAPDGLPRLQEIRVDSLVLVFTFVISVLTGIFFGAAPAFHARHFQLLNDGSKSSAGAERQRVRNALVVSEMALSLLLLIGAGLMIRSFGRLLEVHPGLNPRNLLTARIHLPETRYKTATQVDGFFDELVRRLKVAPGIKAAAANTPLPFSFNEWNTGVWVEGGPPPPSQNDITLSYVHFASPEYLGAMQIPLMRGRNIDYSDNDNAPAVALVNQAFVARYLRNQDPVGKRLRLGGYEQLTGNDFKTSPWTTIVGVVGDVKQYGLDAEQGPEAFLPYTQHRGGDESISSRSVVLRTESDPLAALQVLRRSVQQVDKDQPIADVATMEQLIASSLGPRRTPMYLLVAFAGLALTLSAVGIYGVLSYWVAQRAREIGIRMALGASRADVLGLVVRQGTKLMILGMASGLALAFALGGLLSSQLFNVTAHDPLTFLVVTITLAGVAALSCYIPARRATRVDPLVALRYE